MKKIVSFLMALLLILSLPMTVLAEVTADTSYGDVNIGNTHVDHYDAGGTQLSQAHEGSVTVVHGDGSASGTVSVDMSSGTVEITGDVTDGVVALGDANVTVNGDVSSGGTGVQAEGTSQVTVTGDIDAGGNGVYAEGDSQVTIGGDIAAGEDGVYAVGDSQVTVGGDIDAGDDGVYAGGDSQVTVTGNITSGEDGVDAYGSSQVTVTGNITGDGDGVEANDRSQVTVTGSITGDDDGVEADDSSQVTIIGNITGGNDGVEADDDSHVRVDGNVTGADGDPNEVDYSDPKDYSDGGTGVDADDSAKVEVTGNVSGGNSYGIYGYGGDGVYASGNASVSVDGNVTGGNVTADPDTEVSENYWGWGGDGIYMDSTATVTVGGNVTGGSINADQGFGGSGIHIGYREPEELEESEAPEEPGSVTVGGTVTSSTAENGTDGFGILLVAQPEHLPDISVGFYDSLSGVDYTDQELQSVVSSIKVTGLKPITPTVTVLEEAPRQRAPQQKLLKVETLTGTALRWEELRKGDTLTIRSEEEEAVLIITLEQLHALQKLGIKTIIFESENCETSLVIAQLIAMNGREYILTHKGKTAELTVDGKKTEM